MKNQILEAIQKGIKAGLLESGFNFSLDDLDHIEDYGLKKKKLNKEFFKDEFDRQQKDYELSQLSINKILNEEPLSNEEKERFNEYSNKFVGVYKVNDQVELNNLIYKVMQQFGRKVNLNWIDVSKITNMSYMFAKQGISYPDGFSRTSDFDGDISKWDVSNVEDMSFMFQVSDFKGDISKWNTGNVKTMESMFVYSLFDGNISEWDVSHVKNMRYMFHCSKFNGDISHWNTGNVKNTEGMFERNYCFAGDISMWDVSKVVNMRGMFESSKFNGDISKWNVSSVGMMSYMFHNSYFNRDISRWNVSNVENMTSMFWESKFNRNISEWDVSNVIYYCDIFNDCPIKEEYKPKFKNDY